MAIRAPEVPMARGCNPARKMRNLPGGGAVGDRDCTVSQLRRVRCVPARSKSKRIRRHRKSIANLRWTRNSNVTCERRLPYGLLIRTAHPERSVAASGTFTLPRTSAHSGQRASARRPGNSRRAVARARSGRTQPDLTALEEGYAPVADRAAKITARKNKCGPGQPPKPHCYRGRFPPPLPSFAKDERSSRSALRGMRYVDAHLRLTPQGCHSALPSALEGGCWRRPQRPGTSSLDMNRKSPGDSPSRESPRAEFWSAALQEHTRALTASTVPQFAPLPQPENMAMLCISCGGDDVLVDDGRKTG